VRDLRQSKGTAVETGTRIRRIGIFTKNVLSGKNSKEKDKGGVEGRATESKDRENGGWSLAFLEGRAEAHTIKEGKNFCKMASFIVFSRS